MSRLPHYRILPKDYGNDVNFTQNYTQWCWVTCSNKFRVSKTF